MEISHKAATLEFLEFLADISNPATGEISAERLATWLCWSEAELHQRWVSRGLYVPWPLFADELLSVLDAVQDVTCDLEKTVEWYLHEPIEGFEMRTADEIVSAGEARRLVFSIKRQIVQIR